MLYSAVGLPFSHVKVPWMNRRHPSHLNQLIRWWYWAHWRWSKLLGRPRCTRK